MDTNSCTEREVHMLYACIIIAIPMVIDAVIRMTELTGMLK